MIIKTELVGGTIQIVVSTDVAYLRGATTMERSEGAETIIRLNSSLGHRSIDDIEKLAIDLTILGVEFVKLRLVNNSVASVVGNKFYRISKVPSTAHPSAKSWLHYAGGQLQVQDTEDELRQIWSAANLDMSVFD